MRMRPIASGMLVVPTVMGAKNALGSVMMKFPMATPSAMAQKIHSVRKRSRQDMCLVTEFMMFFGGVYWLAFKFLAQTDGAVDLLF